MDLWKDRMEDYAPAFHFHHLVNGGGFWYMGYDTDANDEHIVKNWDPNGSEFTWGVKLSRSEIKIRRRDRN